MNIKQEINSSGLTVQKFAEKIGVHKATVYRWLNGGVIPRTKQKQIEGMKAGKINTNQGDESLD